MNRTWLLLALALSSPPASGEEPGEPPPALSTDMGLTGIWRIETTDILPGGTLRMVLSPGLRVVEAGTAAPVGLAAGWGLGEYGELGAAMPLYPVDDAWDGGAAGDLEIGWKYLYETTRGGTGLALVAGISVPLGEPGRDAGAGLSAGVASSTVYRLVKVTFEAAYFASGGRNPFESRIVDGLECGVAASSFVAPDVQVFAAAGSRTGRDPDAAAGAMYTPVGPLSAGISVGSALSDVTDIELRATLAATL